jgi:hypothetical protein
LLTLKLQSEDIDRALSSPDSMALTALCVFRGAGIQSGG